MAEDARTLLIKFLQDYGLTGMEGFINDAVTNSWGPETINIKLQDHPTFQQAFPEIKAMKNQGRTPMNPAQILEYRKEVKTMFSNAGIPPGFYDSPDDFVDLIANKDLSLIEVGERIKNGFARVSQAPQEVKDAFNSFFGAQGESALATVYLDPTKGRDLLTKMAAQAEIGGAGKRFGFDININQAARLAEIGVNAGTAAQGFEQAQALRPLAEETISEAEDITSQDLVDSVFSEGTTNPRQRVERRQQERTARFQGSGGAAQTNQGLGLGQAR